MLDPPEHSIFLDYRKILIEKQFLSSNKSNTKTFKPTIHFQKTASTGQKAGGKTQETPKEKNKENTNQTNTLDFRTDPGGIGSDMLYPCCMGGNCALYFYYEDLWKEEKEKENKTAKPECRTEEEK